MNFDYLGDSAVAITDLRSNRLFSCLRKNSYAIYHLYSGYAVTSHFLNADSTIFIDGPREFEKSLLKYTILRLDDLIGFFAFQRLNSQFKKMYDLADIRRSPKFCFMHFVAPHPPYVFDRNGMIRTKHRFTEHSWEPKDFYIDQLVYVNKQITLLLHKIVANDPSATIVIQSDHGPWVSARTKDEVFEARSGIIFAYRSNKILKMPNRTSSVNTFRHLLNQLFGARLAILPDSAAGKQNLMDDPILQKKAEEL